MSSQVKRLIDKDALIAKIQNDISFWKSTNESVGNYALNEGKESILHIVREFESAPVEETLEDVIARIPYEVLLRRIPNGYVRAFVVTDSPNRNDAEWAHGKTYVEAALNLEALLNSKTKAKPSE